MAKIGRGWAKPRPGKNNQPVFVRPGETKTLQEQIEELTARLAEVEKAKKGKQK